MSLTPHEQLATEVRRVLNRWVEESDLSEEAIAEVALSAVDSWLDGPTVSFEPDFDL
mgnify:CR=1 FL=1